jgi:putative MATE family efflux protein
MDSSKQLGESNIGQLLWKFSLPAITGMLVNALYNVVDRIFVGRGVGSLALAGITISFPVMIVLMAFSMLIGMGSSSLISIRLGERRKEEAEQIAGNGLVLLVLIAAVLSLLFLGFLEPLLSAFGASEVVMPYAADYLRVILTGNVLMSIGFGMSNMIRAEGKPVIAMYTILIGGITNILLDYIAIFLLEMGIKGAALATVISQGVSAGWVLYYYLSGKSLIKLRSKNFTLQPIVCLNIFAVGFPPFALQLVHSVQQVLFNKSLTFYGGDLAVAAVGVVFSLGTFMFMPVIGISQAAQPIIGFNYGARQFDRVKATLKLASFWATVIVGSGYIFTRIWPENLIALFSRGDVQLIELGSHAMQRLFLVLPVIGFQIVGAGYFQAVGKPVQATLLSLSRQVLLFIPLLLILPRFWGLEGIWWAAPIADAGATLITAGCLYYEFRARNAPLAGLEPCSTGRKG